MLFNWYNLFNLDEFKATELGSRTLHVNMPLVGQKDILITRSNEVSIVYEDVFLPVVFRGQNPYSFAGTDKTYAVYLDDNNDVWLGIEADQQ